MNQLRGRYERQQQRLSERAQILKSYTQRAIVCLISFDFRLKYNATQCRLICLTLLECSSVVHVLFSHKICIIGEISVYRRCLRTVIAISFCVELYVFVYVYTCMCVCARVFVFVCDMWLKCYVHKIWNEYCFENFKYTQVFAYKFTYRTWSERLKTLQFVFLSILYIDMVRDTTFIPYMAIYRKLETKLILIEVFRNFGICMHQHRRAYSVNDIKCFSVDTKLNASYALKTMIEFIWW